MLLVGQGPPSRGGIPTFVTVLRSDAWLRERADVELLNTTPRGTKHPGAFRASNIGLAFRHAWQIFRRARTRDIVHLNLAATPSLPMLRAVVLLWAARAGGARVILHAHTGQIEESVASPAFRRLARIASRVADIIVVVSESAQAALRGVGVEAELLDNGVDVGAFETGPKDAPPVLSFVGTVCERKGLLDLRDALARLGDREASVLIAGDGAQEGPGAFERVRAAFAGMEGVEFLGALPEEEVRALLARSSIFCLPSHWEGFPLTVLEAMAAETAVVATRVGAIPRMLDEGRSGVVVDPHDAPALGEALGRLLSDDEERRRLARAARARVEREYDLSRMVRSVEELYRSVGPRRSGRRGS